MLEVFEDGLYAHLGKKVRQTLINKKEDQNEHCKPIKLYLNI